MKKPERISVIGAGGWGSALAQLLSGHSLPVTVWAHDPAQVEEINTAHSNRKFLPGVTLAKNIKATPDLAVAAQGDVIIVVPGCARASPLSAARKDWNTIPDVS